jgi:hypothetical protein
MNGPQHYREAEKALEQSRGVPLADGHATWLVSFAQVHATLALAAATIDVAGSGVMDSVGYERARDWEQATS